MKTQISKVFFARLLLALVMATAVSENCGAAVPPYMPSDSVLRRWAAQMLMVGFRGDTIGPDAIRYVQQEHVGAIVLFDVDLTGTAKLGSRNITSREQVAKLTHDLQSLADYKLLIALDQEGGKVARLKPRYGYEPTVTAQYLGETDNSDTTRHYMVKMAHDLASSGINVNLAPVVDVRNDSCPTIGKLLRGFGSEPRLIAKHAGLMIDEHHKQGVLCTLKHFPGHGNSRSDSHWGFVDVTNSWQPVELESFKLLVKKGKADLIMTAHIFNKNLDEDYPATLSRKTIDGVLRNQLGYDGVVVSDDMYMEGIINNYDIERAIVLAINAGCDMLCVGNNISTGFEADRPTKLINIIVRAVKEGRIPLARLRQSHARIEKLLKRL